MALADIDLDYAEVTLPSGKSFSVRGLSLADVTRIVRHHGPVVQEFFLRYAGNRDDLKKTGIAETALALLDSAPALAAEVIALAADEPEHAAKVRKFPMGVQMDALEKIAALTFDSEGGPKKFGEAVVRLLQGTTSLLSDLNQSEIGSLASGGK